ncbi:c-type cytochrome biogenesis protein CcmI [Moraxella bovis]|uniref:c-type cytochrome biogenesis protein CcmI n=1 Tax=Moraxella bovis TaxID=476 RepID=UPI0009928D86|nr:c-type cytochrome biogenesis protein CcmI [Moraxella bovis]OOR91240.1 c-type cytochrome biogenesis protein CcmI [Moraxella bovis]
MTPTLFLFFSLAVLLCVVLALVVIYPWLKGQKAVDNQLMAVNVAVFGERIAELQADKEAGRIDDATFQAGEIELKRQLLDAQTHAETYAPVGIKSRAIVMVWIPVLAGLAYLTTADRTSVFKLWQAQDSVGQVADDLLTGKIDTPPEWATADSTALISAMQTNVHHHAHDPNRWMRLSELFMALEATPQALEALARAYRLDQSNDEIAITYAQTSFFANNGVLDATARDVLHGILSNTPDHEGAMMMMAMSETRANNFTMAKAWVAKLRESITSKGGADRQSALASLDELMATIHAQEAKAMAGVNVHVSVASSLLPQIDENAVLFVSISDVAGGAPYAVKRLSVRELVQGVTVSLSDLDAMMPERTLTAGREAGVSLAVNARISHSGGAVSESGDLMANPVILQKGQNTVNLEISQIVP